MTARTRSLRLATALLPAILLLFLPITAGAAEGEQWISLFNGKDLEGWHVKIRYHDFDDNFGNTFRVEDGVMKVGYEAYGKFNETFGHIYYKEPFSNYRFRVEYRFTGEQAPGGPGWATRNSGIMLHCQDPKTIEKDQDFPVSIEVQFLGGDGKKERTTGNLCTPGTNVVMKDKLITQHCTNSTSKTFHGDQWVTAEVEVHNSKSIKHFINGELVLEYELPQLDEKDAYGKKLIKDGELLLGGGYISLQSESHPVEFRRIEILPLDE
ncbi:MAG: DUF1080 domain-containing protein [Candidatus Hydrogenedentes bacterium]|nr:DUF1080 domain-containing protein [Candidatus Hydrogenedentota bacterium]